MQANHPSLEIDNDLVPIVCSYKCNQLSGNRNKADIGPRTRIQELQLCLNPTLTPEQANEPCINYTPITLLTKLNALTGYELLMEERNLGEGLAQFISGPHDFGIAYAWFRTAFSFIQLPPETLYDMHRTFIVHYAGLPTLQNCDRSLTTANFSNPGALYQEPQIQTAADGSGETIIRLARWNARRFWDVVANRVVPSEWHTRRTRGVTQLTSSSFIPQSLANSLRDSLGLGYVAISHSWASDLQMKISPVNAQQWPIPLPAGVTLETIRDELLSLHGKRIQQTTRFIPTQYRFDYCWLDILCLRQAWYDNAGRLLTWVPGLTQQDYKAQERKRLFEWKTDVPTIGGIYRQANQVYVYLNGIGKPCSGDEKVWRDSNHWTRRAWTLQEWVVSPAGLKPLLMGVSGEVLNSREIDGALQQALVERLTIARALPDINSTIQDSSSCRDLIGRISQRSCSNEVDKIAGLLHFFSEKALPALPVYKPYETAEEAWYRLINALANPWRFALSMALWQQVERQGQLYPSWDAVLHIPERGDSYAESHSMNFGNTLLTRGGPALVAPVALPCWISTFTQVSTDQWTPAELQETQKAPDKYDLRVNFTPSLVEKHYLVPQICLNIPDSPKTPWDYIYLANSYSNRAGHTVNAGQEINFLVCKPLIVASSEWDHVSYQKIGGARMWVPLGSFDSQAAAQDSLLGSWFPHSTAGGNWQGVLEDIHKLTPKQMSEKYGAREIYSLIYDEPSVGASHEVSGMVDLNNLQEIKMSLLLNSGLDINDRGTQGRILGAAVQEGDLDLISLLLDHGVCTELRLGNDYRTALSLATWMGNVAVISLLLDRGADINVVGGMYGTPLGIATWRSDMEMVSLFLNRGAEANLKFGGKYGTALGIAVRCSKVEVVSLLLDRGAAVNLSFGGEYGTALGVAVRWSTLKMVSLLLYQGAEVNMIFGGECGTALGVAVRYRKVEVVSLLLDLGAAVNLTFGGAYGTALGVAVRWSKMEVVSLLLDRGAKVNLGISGKYGTALGVAVWNNHVKIISLLLDRGADINVIGGEYGTALGIAVWKGHADVILLLLDRGADIDAVGGTYGTALSVAALKGNEELASLLLAQGAGINVIGGEYGTTLGVAVWKNHVKMISLLLDRGADINVIGGEYGTALGVAVWNGHEDVILLFLNRGADINAVGGTYGTALGVAASQGNEVIVSLLLVLGADINVVGGEYGTALGVAVWQGNVEMIMLLLDRGADINAVGGTYGTALGVAILNGNEEIVSLLLVLGAGINIIGGEYGTALGVAVGQGNVEMIMLLLDRGADINAIGGTYGTALAVAALMGNAEVVLLLLDIGANVNLEFEGEYGTALAVAKSRAWDNEHVVLLLLERGANI